MTHPLEPRGHKPLGDGRPFHLIFDADDTLWDSNIHFLEAEAHFVAELVAAGGGRDGSGARRDTLARIGNHQESWLWARAIRGSDANARGRACAQASRNTLGAAVERIARAFSGARMRVAARRRADAHGTRRAPSLDPIYQGASARAAAQARALRTAASFQPRRSASREGRGGVPTAGRGGRARPLAHFHDRQQSALGHQPGVARGPARGLSSRIPIPGNWSTRRST